MLRKGSTNLPQTWHAYALKLGKIVEKSRSEKVSLARVPVRMVSVTRILCTMDRKIVLGLSPGKDVYCTLETNVYRRTKIRPKLLFRRVNYRNKDHNPEQVSWAGVLVKMISVEYRKLIALDDSVKKRELNLIKQQL
jgi:hypothetical protein